MKKLAPGQWTPRSAAHLLVRAGFGATPEQIDAASGQPLPEVVSALLTPPSEIDPPNWVKPGMEEKPDFSSIRELSEKEQRERRRSAREEQNRQHRELTDWWVRRMISSPCPLQEKMALFWHGHFATSFRKVRSAYMMYRQNQTFRTLGMGNFHDLVTAVAQDPAMLIYLDNTRSRAGAPNENFARELMELFTLGEGHYTEQDIKEAARAFTGWMVHPKRYEFLDASTGRNRRMHDDGVKEFFGESGRFDGHDIIRIILKQPQAARFIAEKMWRFLAYDNPEQELIDALADEFRKSDYAIARLLENIFTSEAFYSEKAMRTQIKSPAQWLAGSCIVLGLERTDPKFCLNALRSLGQELFVPPNVKGWDGGFAWITTSSLAERYNLAKTLIQLRPGRNGSPGEEFPAVKAEAVLPPEYRSSTAAAQSYLEHRIYQSELTGADRDALTAYLAGLPPADKWNDTQIRNVLRTMMSTPQFQLT